MGSPSQDDSLVLQLLDDFSQADHGSDEEKAKLDAIFAIRASSSTANAKSFVVDGEADKKNNDLGPRLLCESHDVREISTNYVSYLELFTNALRDEEAPNPSVCPSASYSGIGKIFGSNIESDMVAIATDPLLDQVDSQPGPGGPSSDMHMECSGSQANMEIDISWSEIYSLFNQDLSSPQAAVHSLIC